MTAISLPSPAYVPTESERRSFVRRRPLSLRQWAERRLKIVDGPVADGRSVVPFSCDLFPPQRDVLDAIDRGSVGRRYTDVVLLTAPQAWGKTTAAAIAPAMYAIEHLRRSVVYVGATQELAVSVWRRKFKKAIDADPELLELIPENPDYAGTRTRRDFTNGCSLHMPGGESISALSSHTAPVIICDDCQAMPDNIPGFGHPADYAESRAKAFPPEARTIVKLGTASTVESWLWRTLCASTFYVPFVPCPSCGAYQMIEFDRLCYDASDPAAAAEDCWLRCANGSSESEGDGCVHQIRFEELPEMLDSMLWVSMPDGADWIGAGAPDSGQKTGANYSENDSGEDEAERPESSENETSPPWFFDAGDAGLRTFPDTDRRTSRAGFWCSALYWPHGASWGQIAAEFLSCRGDPDKLKTFGQNVLVRPWAEPESEGDIEPATLGEHKTVGHEWRKVPDQADVVTLAVDVHSSGEKCLYYEVVAWRRADAENWLIDAGTIGLHGPRKGEIMGDAERWARWGAAIDGGLADAYEMERAGWPHRNGVIRAELVLVDGGHRPDRVGPFCWTRTDPGPVKGRKWWMIQGAAGERQIIERDGRGRLRVQDPRGGYRYLRIGVDTAKHRLRDILGVPRDHPGYCHFYADRDLAAYYRHLSSENCELVTMPNGVKKMRWTPRKRGIANHWLDCRVYNIAAALLCGVQFVGEPLPRKPVQRRKLPRVRTPDGRAYLLTER